MLRALGAGLRETVVSRAANRIVARENKTYRVATVTIQRANAIALENFNVRAREANEQAALAKRKVEKSNS